MAERVRERGPVEAEASGPEVRRRRRWAPLAWAAVLGVSFFLGAAIAPQLRPETTFVESGLPPENQLAASARAAMAAKHYAKARDLLQMCVNSDPTAAECHKLLGTVYAKMGKPEEGARHYREFLRYEPIGADSDKVRAILEAYDR